MQPLIVTARLAPAAQQTLNALRERFFPPARNMLDAHLTLLHDMPAEHMEALEQYLRKAASALPLEARLSRVRPWATGFAAVVECDALVAMHKAMTTHFEAVLTAQDLAKLGPHVTLQNKTDKAQSGRDFLQVKQLFVPQPTHIVAYDVWRYDGGPWTHLASHPPSDAQLP